MLSTFNMHPKIILSRPVFMRLNEITQDCTGELFGIIYGSRVLITGLNFDIDIDLDIDDEDAGSMDNLYRYIYPAGVDWCGVFQIKQIEITNKDKNLLAKLKVVAVTNNPIILTRIISEEVLQVSLCCDHSFRDVHYTIMEEEEFVKEFIHFRIKSKRSVISSTSENIVRDVHKFRKKLSSGAAMFKFNDTDVYVHSYAVEEGSFKNVGHLCETSMQPSKIRNSPIQGPYEATVVFSVCNTGLDEQCSAVGYQDLGEREKLYAPTVLTVPVPRKMGISRLRLLTDVLCVTHKECLVGNLYGILMEGLYRWLDVTQLFFTKCIHEKREIIPVQLYHFHPEALGHYVSLVFPEEATDEQTADIRAMFHSLLNLPTTRPFFCRANMLQLGTRNALLNVHKGLHYNSSVENGKVATVRGSYEYYHYMQDSFDDIGWGCAYRSFQTIFSWFKLQGYTTKQVPSHKDIQECLVRLGDKPANFVNSHTWIGSIEISFCLQEMLGVDSLMLSVSSGKELYTLGRQLLHHFQTVGTPVMIGGGQLAHTILGVDFNEESDDIMFLVLDPHFVACADEKDYLPRIYTKGAVSWKRLQFWSQRNFYNLCLATPSAIY